MNRSRGFTLIELAIVIVLLGILTVVALPKFIDLQSDARAAALSHFAGTVKVANQQLETLSHMSSYRAQPVSGRDDLTDVDIDGDGTFETRLKCRNLDNTDVIDRLEYSEEQFTWELDDPEYLYIGYAPKGQIKASNCYFEYTQANGAAKSCPADNDRANYRLVTSGC